MRKLDQVVSSGHPENALIYAVCALGAKVLAIDYCTSGSPLTPQDVLAAGTQWAKESLRLVFADLDLVSVEILMAVVLLHDHELRVGRFASSFMLTAVGSRLAQALQTNVEYSTDVLCLQELAKGPLPAAKESRRRVEWAVYIMDAWVGSG